MGPKSRWSAAAAAVLALAALAHAADSGKQLLSAARAGDAPSLKALLAKGAPLEARDKSGKTPLILAAQGGYAAAVKMLLEKGANPDARDKQGMTAFARALFSLDGSERDAMLAILPHPPRIRLIVEASWLPVNVGSSCFLSRGELAQLIGGIHPDALTLREFGAYLRTSGRDLVEIQTAEAKGIAAARSLPAAGEADAVVTLEARPGAACGRQSDSATPAFDVQQSDIVTLAIDVRVFRAQSGKQVFAKTFGGGLRGLHAQPVTNATQYEPLYEQWARTHADSIYWAVVKALLSTEP